MPELLMQLISFLLIAVIVGWLYKYRHHIKRFIKEERYGGSWSPSQTTIAQRSVIKAEWRLEDAKDRLKYEQEKDEKEPKEETNVEKT